MGEKKERGGERVCEGGEESGAEEKEKTIKGKEEERDWITSTSLTILLCFVLRESSVTLTVEGSECSCWMPSRASRCLLKACIKPDPRQSGTR